jgi:hypothetical protein
MGQPGLSEHWHEGGHQMGELLFGVSQFVVETGDAAS